MRNSGVVSTTNRVRLVSTSIDGRVRWFFGLARNSGGYSLPMIGTPCEVPEPRKVREKLMSKLQAPSSKIRTPKDSLRHAPDVCDLELGAWSLELSSSFFVSNF